MNKKAANPFEPWRLAWLFLVAWLVLWGRGIESSAQTLPSNFSFPTNCTQLIVVTTANWDAVPGHLTQYERKDAQSHWKKVHSTIPIVVGRSGLGWGAGLQPVEMGTAMEPHKKEGDGRSPAGIYRLGEAFGLTPSAAISGIKLPYLQLDPETECVDDVKSVHYNSIVGGSVRPKDWDSSEHMQGVGAQYRLGVVVEHNFDPRTPGGGSCIFMHIWKNSETGTSGCTAMSPENMEKFIRWLNPENHPLLVQLPKSRYQELRKPWSLP